LTADGAPGEAEARPAADDFAGRVLAWYADHGRRDLPWHRPATPYRVWISEVMLQQTRVETVRPYFERFVERFPDTAALAAAALDDVLAHWSGLGYYARARNLHRAAQQVVGDHGGELPDDFAALQALPGIGRSTAAAIQSLARGRRHAILDGNVKRVLARHAGIEGWPGRSAVARELWAEAEARTPAERVAAYNQAMMDLGAGVCGRRPQCMLCPVADDCRARLAGRTDRIPAARPRTAWPTRETAVLVVRRRADRAILLERRAPGGIWGGLWSLPEFADAGEAESWLATRGIDGSLRTLDPVEHGFTHFRLVMHPLLAEVDAEPEPLADGRATAWHTGARSPGGLPAPISRLVARLGASAGA